MRLVDLEVSGDLRNLSLLTWLGVFDKLYPFLIASRLLEVQGRFECRLRVTLASGDS